jgi:hypothetical protein
VRVLRYIIIVIAHFQPIEVLLAQSSSIKKMVTFDDWKSSNFSFREITIINRLFPLDAEESVCLPADILGVAASRWLYKHC